MENYRGTGRKVLIIVQNLPVPFDRRVWQEAQALVEVGYKVSIISPKGKGHMASYEYLSGIHIYRHPLPMEGSGALGYVLEYSISLFWEWLLAWKIYFRRGFDVIHACNPPDTIFLIAGFFKLFLGVKFIFDHHDINPELYDAKFVRRDFFYKLICWLERFTFATADISIATNNSYRDIAITRGNMAPDKVFVVRSGPSLERIKIVPAVANHKMGKRFLVGYVGVIGQQEGIHYLINAVHYIVYMLKREDIHFTIVGSGPALAAMKTLAEQENVGAFITFTGRVDDGQLFEILNTADICVNPDEVNAMNDKSTMNKIMEYMALGKPIVQFDVKEGKFTAGDASLYAKANDTEDFASKIITLLDDASRRNKMGEEGRRRIEQKLAWPYERPKLIAAYEAVFTLPSRYKKYKWLYYRLRAMSFAEVVHRMLEASKRKWDKFKIKYHSQTGVCDVELFLIKEFQEKIAEITLSAEISLNYHCLYDQAKAGKYHLLGYDWPADTSDNKWHLDPITKTYWPRDRYCFDIAYRHAPAYGDVKYVWELSRLQYLQPLAILALKENNPEIAHFCLFEIESWIDNNPVGYGIHWASGIELSLRTISMIVVVTLLKLHFTQAQREKITQSLYAHTKWIERYRSAYSSANNHLLTEAIGLLAIGTACNFKQSERWKSEGWKILCTEIEKQILDDGVGAERSIAYTQFAIEIFEIGDWLASANNMPVPNNYSRRLSLAKEWLRWFKDAGGNHPNIGDDDNGVVINKLLLHSICMSALHEQTAPLGVHSFDKGGYSVARFKTLKHNIMLALDHGDVGYLSIAAHGHADALALWLHMDDQPILVDCGTYLYHSGGAWRDYFRSTSAHNTLSIQGEDSSTMAGAFNWSYKASADLKTSNYVAETWRIEASHNGYSKRFNVIHNRALEVTFAHSCKVIDTLITDKPQQVEVGYLIHPALQVIQEADEIHVIKDNEILLGLRHEGLPNLFIYRPGDARQGWYSESFGKKVATTRIVFSGGLAPYQQAITYLLWQ